MLSKREGSPGAKPMLKSLDKQSDGRSLFRMGRATKEEEED